MAPPTPQRSVRPGKPVTRLDHMLARRLKTLAPSSTLAVQAKAKALRAQGVNVISFGAGEPDFDTPERIKEAAVQAMRRGHTKYTEVGGVPELRAAVCAKLQRDNGLRYEPADVLISCGAKHTLFNMVTALVNPGDEVLVPSPFWVSYPEQIKLVDGVPVPVDTLESTGFDLDVDRLRAAVTPRTKAIILNSPNNPTGAVFSPEALQAVARLAVERGLWVISDECYEALTFEGRHVSVASFGPEIKARTLVVNTCSKAYAMTGWRIGYAAGPRALITAMTDVQSQVTSNPSSVAQWAAVEALAGAQDEVAKMAGEFDRRRRLIIAGLNALPGVSCVMPKGAFYAFANVSGLFGRTYADGAASVTMKGSLDVTAFLLERAQVAVVPGLDFGSDAHVRLSYATSDALITEGLQRMTAAIKTLG
jgi:aspartate aminotransferase